MNLLLQYRTSLETNIIRKHNLESDNTNWTPRLKKYLRGQELSMVQSGHKDVSFLLLWLMLLYLLFVCWLVCLLFIFCFLYFLSSFCSFFFFHQLWWFVSKYSKLCQEKSRNAIFAVQVFDNQNEFWWARTRLIKASPDVIKMWNLVE